MATKNGQEKHTQLGRIPKQAPSASLEEVNARLRRKASARKVIEADLEAKSRGRRAHEAPASSKYKA
jgi:hypothetical protein